MVGQSYTNSIIRDTFNKKEKPKDTNQVEINKKKDNTNIDLAKTINMRGAKNGIRQKPADLN